MIAFNRLNLQASAGFDRGRRRRLLVVRMMGDDAHPRAAPLDTSPDFAGLKPGNCLPATDTPCSCCRRDQGSRRALNCSFALGGR